MTKDFDNWNFLKKKLHEGHGIPTFRQRDIWWCSIGVNIGHEEDGKNKAFNRPILVVKKFNHRMLWGIPLTTQIKEQKHYHNFVFKHQEQCAMLTQLKLLDAKRLTHKMGALSEKEYKIICQKLQDYLK